MLHMRRLRLYTAWFAIMLHASSDFYGSTMCIAIASHTLHQLMLRFANLLYKLYAARAPQPNSCAIRVVVHLCMYSVVCAALAPITSITLRVAARFDTTLYYNCCAAPAACLIRIAVASYVGYSVHAQLAPTTLCTLMVCCNVFGMCGAGANEMVFDTCDCAFQY